MSQTKAQTYELNSEECKTFNMEAQTGNTLKDETVEKQYDNIIKSVNDNRLYRGLVLGNKMKVLLVSDPTTDKSAASMNVQVGYMNDPDDLPGLAHFCEHMLFLGTEKYPLENEYNSYLSQHGGTHNAVTSQDFTNYHFDVTSNKFEEALHRFAQFFIAPLFTQTMTDLELNAIHLEHMKNLACDIWRCRQLDKSSADPNHPISKFGTGNRETLDILPKEKGINVRKQLLEFHRKYYSANIMSLCVLAKESLDDLEKMVREMFSQVQNKEIELPVWPKEPFKQEHFQHKWYIVPMKDIHTLDIMFPMPDLHDYYRSRPAHYISHLLGHEGDGSLLSVLKTKSWCNALGAGLQLIARGIYVFNLVLELTEEGIQHVDDIIRLTFCYINLLKKEGPLEWIYNEYKDIADINFRFKEKSSPRSYVSGTAQSLHSYPMEEALTMDYLFHEWRPDLIDQIMEYLIPQNIRVHITSKVFKDSANEKEKWYGTEYKKERIPDELIENWTNAGLDPSFKLPVKNEFIPTKFDVKPQETDVNNEFPIIVEDTPFIRFWYKQDDQFLMPKAILTFAFVSPLAYLDPINRNCCSMFVRLLRDSLNEYAYNADLAGLQWDINDSTYGMRLLIYGFDDKQRIFLEKIMDRMVNFTINPKRFEIIKEMFVRTLKNWKTAQPHQQAGYYLAVLLSEEAWVRDDLLEACSYLTIDTIQQFISQFFSKIHVEGLIHGNTTLSEAVDLARLVETKLTYANPHMIPLLPAQMTLHREIRLEDGAHFLYETNNEFHANSCTSVYYQIGVQTTESNMLLELLLQIISGPCYNVLRTKEQLGYIVASNVRRSNGVQGLRIIVQSDKSSHFVEQRISAFMNSMMQRIATMPEEEFTRHKESVAARRLEKHKVLHILTAAFWIEISSQQYHFDRANVEVEYLRTITRKQILQFYKQYVYSEGRRKLCIYVNPTTKNIDDTSKNEDETIPDEDTISSDSTPPKDTVKNIEDILSFKTSQSLYPFANLYSNIPRKGVRSPKL